MWPFACVSGLDGCCNASDKLVTRNRDSLGALLGDSVAREASDHRSVIPVGRLTSAVLPPSSWRATAKEASVITIKGKNAA